MDKKIFEVSALDELYELNEEGEDDLVAGLIKDFVAHSELLSQRIAKGYREGDLSELEEASHSLKSSSRMLGCYRLSHLAEMIEERARDKKLQDCETWVTELGATLSETITHLLAHQKEKSQEKSK